MSVVRLAEFNNSWYSPGRNLLVQGAWYFFGLPLLRASWIPSSGFRRTLLRLFGARIGSDVILKPGIRIKYPWLLEIGVSSWIGEDVWIDNLVHVQIGSNVCVSQGAYICTGNHDWSDPAFGLIVRPVTVQDGAWIGARAFICPGIQIAEHAVVTAGSVVTTNLLTSRVYGGNPAREITVRAIRPAG